MTDGSESEQGAIFKSLHKPNMSDKEAERRAEREEHAERALRLRETLNVEMRIAAGSRPESSEIEAADQYEDTEEEEFEVASMRGGENEEPNVCSSGSNFSRSALIAKLDVRSACTPPCGERGVGSVSSKVFQDQLSARFRARKQKLDRLTSGDSCDETYGA